MVKRGKLSFKILSLRAFTCSKTTVGKTRTRYEICWKLTRKIQERHQCWWSGVFTVNFEHTSQLNLAFLLLTLNRQMKCQKQWHNGKMGRWLHSKCFLVILPDYHMQGKRSNYICKLTVIFYLSYMHSIFRTTLNSKTSSVSWFKNLLNFLELALAEINFWLFQRTCSMKKPLIERSMSEVVLWVVATVLLLMLKMISS